MRRQLIGLSVLAAVGVAGAWVVPGPAMGETTADDVVVVRSFPADRPAFRRLAVGVGRTPAVLPGYLRSRSLVTATVLLAGESVADAVIAEQAAGRNPTKSQRSLKRRAVAAAQSALLRRVQDSGVGVVYVMQDAINGVVVRGTPAQIESLRLLPGVLEVEPSKTVMRSNTQANSGTGVSAVWEETGTTGAGQVIAVIDTGVDYTHSTFGGTGDPADFAANDSTLVEPGSFPTAKVVGGWDFVGDAFDSSSDDPAALVPTQDADPLDCEGHGTHVAGTAAGLGVNPDGTTYTGPYTEADVASLRIGPGSAPGANLLAYRVFGCDGTTDGAIVVAALDRAFRDGATVANLSLGAPFGAANDIETRAVNRLSRAGMLVVAAAGNSGHAPYLVGTSSTADRALSVAAFDAVPTLPIADLALTPSGNLTLLNSNEATFSLTADLYVLDDGFGGIGLGCTADEYPAAVSGKIAVTLRGGCPRTDRAVHGQAAGAVAVIMVNDQSGYPPVEYVIPSVTIPFLGAEPEAAATLVAANGTAVSVANSGTVTNPGYLAAASFTSGGPRSGDSAAKPDVSAPGVDLVSALVGSGSEGVHASGTSMAAPHTSGIAALVRATHPAWGPAEVKAALMNTATADGLVGYSTRLQGTGLVNAPYAVGASVVAVTDDGSNALSFGYRPSGHRIDETRRFTIQNDAPYSVAYDLSAVVNGASWGAELRVDPPRVVVPSGAKRSVRLRITMDKPALAGLPGVSFNEVDPDDLTTVRGVVQAVPVWSPVLGAAPNPPQWNALRVPFLLVPRGESRVEVGGLRKVGRRGAGGEVLAVQIANKGIHAGYADVFAWQLSDRRGDAPAADDIVSVGIQNFLFDEATGDQLLVVAVNFAGHRSTAAPREVDLPIDTDGDEVPDYLVLGVDSGLVLDGIPNGVFATFVLRLSDGEIVGAWQGDAPMNGSTVLLPFLASEVGLSASTPTPFRYGVEVLDLISGRSDSLRDWASWNPFSPPVATGQGALLEPGAKDVLLITDPGKKAAKAAGVKGYLIVTVDDRNGTDQAERINLR